MKIRRNRSSDETLWFISYSDLITAILAVLILLMSFSKVDIEKVDHANRLMKDEKMVTLSMLKSQYEQLIQERSLDKKVNLVLDDEGLLVNMSSSVQFKSDSAVLNRSGIEELQPIMDKIVEDSKLRQISIIGHTDDTGTVQRNWELSSQRAFSVLMYLVDHGLSHQHAHIIAHASNHPLIPLENLSKEQLDNARAMNRRVTIVIGRSYR